MGLKSFISLRAVLLVGVMGLGLQIQAQQHMNRNMYWLAYVGDNKINTRFGVHSEAQLRNIGLKNNTMQSAFIRAGFHYYTSSSSMVSLGYGYFSNEPSNESQYLPKSRENQIWEQFISRKKTDKVFMEHRYRMEHRWIDNLSTQTLKLSHRFRYRFQAIIPFYSISPYLRHFFWVGWDEIFLNPSSKTDEIFDRNRVFMGLGYQVSPKMNFQLGYVYQYAAQPVFTHGSINNIALLSVVYNMDDLMRTFFVNEP